jgi:ABC-type polar amino acid transport system ATPase subunit
VVRLTSQGLATAGRRTILEIRGLTKAYGGRRVIDGLDLTLREAEVLAVLGPSGSGKSTMLRCINGLETIESGEIHLGGSPIIRGSRNIYAMRQKIGFVFQSFNLFSHLTAAENVMLGPRIVNRRPRNEVAEEAHQLLAKVGLAHRASALPSRLSGGEQQRVAIARALAMHPDLILFDEPTSALDPENVGSVLRTIDALAHEGMAMIVVTHELGFARDVAHRVAFMDGGRVVEEGPAHAVLDKPSTSRLKEFLGPITRR